MYYPHFGLKEPPFKITPNTDFFFSGGNRGAVLDALVYAITNGEGIIKVVGEVGSGKTMLCRMLQTILPEHIESIYLANPSMAPEDVLHAIAFELQLKLPKNADRLKVMHQLQAYLLDRHAHGRQVVIFVEEAQSMPLATLEEIRLLSNLETKQDKLLQIVLFGQPELDVNLNETNIRQLRERITHGFQLGPLHTKDIGEYIIFRLRAAGYHGPHLFTDAALKRLSKSAQGLVRRVNILADKALLAAFSENLYQVTPRHVKAAIKDSEFGNTTKPIQAAYIWAITGLLMITLAIAIAWYVQQPRVPSSQQLQSMQSPVSQSAVAVKSAVNEITAKDLTKLMSNSSLPVANAAVGVPAKFEQTSLQQVAALKPAVAPASNTIAPVAPIPASDAVQQLVDKRLGVSQNWLQTGLPTTVTLQIMTLTSDEQLKAQLEMLSRQLEVDNVYLYRKNQNGAAYTVVLYGAYAQRDEAMAALQELPQAIKNNKPHIRTIAGINRDIEQAQ